MLTALLLAMLKGAAVGGFIGYATNRLAVWMLFHPKQPVRFLGRRLPLTPGLVVKNQTRLAEAVGRSVSRDLLDPQTVVNELRNVQIAHSIAGFIREERLRLAASEETLPAWLGEPSRPILTEASTALARSLAAHVPNVLADLLHPDAAFRKTIDTELDRLADTPLQELIGPEAIARLTTAGIDQLTAVIQSESTSDLLLRTVQGGLAAFPNSAAFASIESTAQQYAEGRIPVLAAGFQESLAGYLGGDEFGEAVRPRLASRLYAAIIEKFPMARMVVTERVLLDTLTQKWDAIAGELEELARGESVNRFLCEQLDNGARNLTESIREALLDEEAREPLAAWLTDQARQGADGLLRSGETNSRLSQTINNLTRQSLRDLAPASTGWLRNRITLLCNSVADKLSAPDSQDWLARRIEVGIRRALLETPIRTGLALIPENHWPEVEQGIGRLLEERTLRMVPAVLSQDLRLDQLVARKIEDFEATKLEETIQRVSGRELKGIIRLGGLIGVAVGALIEAAAILLR